MQSDLTDIKNQSRQIKHDGSGETTKKGKSRLETSGGGRGEQLGRRM